MDNENIEIIEDNNKKKGSKRPYVIAILMALLLVITITATSYAYFTANVSGTGQNNVVTTTSLEIEFTDGPQVALENAVPGQYIEKTFKVENKGSGDTPYDVYMSEVINDFADKSDLVYTLTSSDGGANISETQVPDVNTKIVNSHLLRAGETHNYVLRITFKETNDNQDDNKGKKFSTVIRVNEVKELETLINKVNSFAEGANTTSTDVIGDTGLAYDGTEDNNLRYVGVNPNNYIQFNNELWRIIGVMNNIETESGENKSLVKVVRNESLGEYVWDSSLNTINNGNGINQWGESTYEDGTPYEGADLMRELNFDYLGNVVVGTDGKWYSGPNNEKSVAMPNNMLSAESQSMIESINWRLGSPNNDNGVFIYVDDNRLKSTFVYSLERANNNGKKCSSGVLCTDTVLRTTSWTGKIGLMYLSDYLLSTTGGTSINRDGCMNLKQYSWNDNSVSDCKNNTWIYNSTKNEWMLSPATSDSKNYYEFVIFNGGRVSDSYYAHDSYSVRPVVYLKSSVKITGGAGTSTNPYTLE